MGAPVKNFLDFHEFFNSQNNTPLYAYPVILKIFFSQKQNAEFRSFEAGPKWKGE